MAQPKTYTFKPMKGLTGWTLGLMVAEIVGLVLWALGMVLSMMLGDNIGVGVVLLIGVFVSVAMMVVSGIVSLCWVYGATRNAKAMKPGGVTTTPGWAVAWFFIPIASLWKPYQTLNDVWTVSVGAKSPLILTWWLLFVFGNLVLRIPNDDGPEGTLAYPNTFGNWAQVVGILLLVASTVLFYVVVRTINRNQIAHDTRIVDQF